MTLVLDASTLLTFLLDDEESPLAEEAMLRAEDGAAAPVIWWYEVRNAIAVNERRKRLSKADADLVLDAIAHLRVEVDRETPQAIFYLARKHSLTVYDAAYLELALRRELPLATLDDALRKAAKTEGVSLIG